MDSFLVWTQIRENYPEFMGALEWVRIILVFGLLLFPVFLGVALWRRSSRRPVIFLGCYGLIYMVLSAAGQSRIVNHGGRDWCEEWHPKWILVEHIGFSLRPKADFTLLGFAFWPCIVVDSLVWHPTYRFEDY